MREAGPGDLSRVSEAAARVLASGLVQAPGEALAPVPIHSPDGTEIAGWLVGVAAGDRLVGFLQFAADLTFRRYSSFQRRPPSLDGCPDLADWLAPSRILEQARTQAATGEELSAPFLTYDRNPDRLVWAVGATDSAGRQSMIYVAGGFAYRAAPGGGAQGPVTG